MAFKTNLNFLLLACLVILVLSCSPAREVTQAPQKTESKIDVVKEIQKVPEEKTGPEISVEVKEMLEKHKSRVKSVYYHYRGPETGNNFHEFYVKGTKIKYKPAREIQSLDQPDSFDSVFIDKTAETAMSYCEAIYCAVNGKKADLSYGGSYISTVFDWISVTKAEKVGEEVIDDRATWKIDSNKGILWVDTFYGIPLKVESNGKTYKFEQISVNRVQDSDVNPTS